MTADRGAEPVAPSARVGIVGSGAITHAHVPALLRLGAEVSVYSRHGADALAKRYGIRPCATLDELLNTCDVVDICTPTTTHLHFIETALRAGKHVICEKPIVRHAREGAAVASLAEAVGRQVLPAHVVRYFVQYAQAREAVQAGRLGPAREARFSRVGAFPSASWFADDEQSGGVVLDLMIHDLDAARWILGEVAEVRGTVVRDAQGARADARLSHRNGAVTHVTALWGPPETPFRTSLRIDGAAATFERSSDGDPVPSSDLSASAGPPSPGGRVAPRGTSGAYRDPRDRRDPRYPRYPQDPRDTQDPQDPREHATPDPSPSLDDPYLLQLREFLTAIDGGPAPRVNLADGIRAVELAEAVLASAARGGGPVSV